MRGLSFETSYYGRYTFALHLRAAALDAVATGVLLLNEFVARKALGASDLAITVLLMLPSLAQLLNLYWAGTSGRDPRSVFLWVGVPSRLAMLAMAFVSQSPAFIVFATIASTASTIVIPAQNALYQSNYAPGERGWLYARVSAAAALVTVAVSTALGWLYDRDETFYRWAYPAGGVVAALGSLAWYRIRWRRREEGEELSTPMPTIIASVPRPALAAVRARVARGLFDPFRASVKLFAEDRDFLIFELGFMTYGLCYMMLQPVLPIFLVDELKVSYQAAANAKGLLFYGVMIALLPVAGWLNDRIGPIRVAVGSFLLLACFPGMLRFAHDMRLVYVAYAVFGAAMAGVSIAWTLGPLTLAGTRSAERYMGAHVSLVAVRGLIGYPLGVTLMRLSSPRLTFTVAAVFALLAAAIMGSIARRREEQPML